MQITYLDYDLSIESKIGVIKKKVDRKLTSIVFAVTLALTESPMLETLKKVCVIDYMVKRPAKFSSYIVKRCLDDKTNEKSDEFEKFLSELKYEGIQLPPEVTCSKDGYVMFNDEWITLDM